VKEKEFGRLKHRWKYAVSIYNVKSLRSGLIGLRTKSSEKLLWKF